MENKRLFYVTTPIYYVNDKPHVGHAYSTVIADAIARFKRLSGFDVFFLTGTDEHGLKIEKEAALRGVSPKELADSVHVKFKELFFKLDISYDRFIRTTDEDHVSTVKHVFKKLLDSGGIYLSEYEGWYCISCETFLTEKSLVDGNCPQCGKKATRIKEESYFLKLEKYEKQLLYFIEKNPGFIKPDFRKNEVLSFVREGLKDLSISRTSFQWGIPVPGNERHVIYVWFDALLNYLTGIGYEKYMAEGKGDFSSFFKTANHVIGKDILKFHAVYWPIMLFALGLEPPKTLLAHGWWLMGGKKMSKSLGNVADPVDLIDKFGADPLRYYLLSEITLGLDGDFNADNFVSRYNSALANDLGNLVSRASAMLNKFTDGFIPGPETDMDDSVIAAVYPLLASLDVRYGEYDFARILEDTFKFINSVNKYINDSAPWKLNQDDENDLKSLLKILKTAFISIYYISYLIYPFMPSTSRKINAIMNIKPFDMLAESGLYINPKDTTCRYDEIFSDASKISRTPEILFPRLKP